MTRYALSRLHAYRWNVVCDVKLFGQYMGYNERVTNDCIREEVIRLVRRLRKALPHHPAFVGVIDAGRLKRLHQRRAICAREIERIDAELLRFQDVEIV